MNRNEEMRDKAVEFHKQHPEVWMLFVKFTFQLIDRGFKNYSARGVWHRIRWETATPEHDKNSFKLNNNHTPFYARRFMKMYPQYEGFFRTREQISKSAPATGMKELGPDYFDIGEQA